MMCVTSVVTVFNDNFVAYGSKQYTVDAPKIEGYTPIGIVGFSPNNTYVQCVSFVVSDNKVSVYAYNTFNGDFNNATCNAVVLYTKNI